MTALDLEIEVTSLSDGAPLVAALWKYWPVEGQVRGQQCVVEMLHPGISARECVAVLRRRCREIFGAGARPVVRKRRLSR